MLLFYVPDPASPGKPFVAVDVTVNPYDPKHMELWRNLAGRSHWHLVLVGAGDRLVDLFEFPNVYGLEPVLDQVQALCREVPPGSFEAAKAEFGAKHSITELLDM